MGKEIAAHESTEVKKKAATRIRAAAVPSFLNSNLYSPSSFFIFAMVSGV